MSHPLLVLSQSVYLVKVVDTNSNTEWQTVQIQISWLLQKPTDLDLHCLQRQGISGLSRTRVNPCHVEQIQMPHVLLVLSQSRLLIQIHILMTKRADPEPTDLDLHCLHRQGISRFSRTRVYDLPVGLKTFSKHWIVTLLVTSDRNHNSHLQCWVYCTKYSQWPSLNWHSIQWHNF